MSVSKWRYTEECNGRPCPGDCDHCSFEPGDLISRAEVHKTLSLLATEGGTDAKMLLSDAHEFIDALPSAEAVQGEWIEKGGELVCSVCGNSVSFSRTPKGWVLGRFCQTCGAKMKGGDTE